MIRLSPATVVACMGCVLLPLTLGCGKGVGTVSGKVTYQGKPLRSAMIVFVGEDGVVSPAVGLSPDGSYTATNVPTGLARISIDTVPPPPPENRYAKQEMDAWNKVMASFVYVPPKYKDPNQSGKTFLVKTGHNTCDLDLD